MICCPLTWTDVNQGKVKKTKKFALVKRMLNPNDIRLQAKQQKKEQDLKEKAVRRVAPVASSLFLAHNTSLVPPYRVLIDTNFINFSLQNKLELISGMMDCLYAKCESGIPCVTDCVMAELEKLGHKYRVALRVARDPRFERLTCTHSGTYADDCLVQRVNARKCYIVATCDRELRRRIRQIPGIPLMYIVKRRYAIERLPDQGAPV
ncbi:Fcf1-domain-containing protein [Lentinula edodes]|nr:Fcf1-domain-containing protein [Lentinula edodes]